MTVCHSSGGILQWVGVVRERIPVHRHADYRSSPLGKPIKELGIRRAVLLDRDTSAPQPELGCPTVECREQLAPGVRLGRNNPRRQIDFTERGNGLGSTRGDAGAAECPDKRSTVSRFLDKRDEGACADARQQDDEVDLSTDERIGEGDRLAVAFNRDFTQRGCGDRLAAVIGNEGRHLGAAAALETQDPEVIERRSRRGHEDDC